MSERKKGLIIGGIIIVIGIISLLANMNILYNLDALANAAFFFLLAYLFYYLYHKNNMRIWALLVSIVLGIIGFVYLSDLFWSFSDNLVGAVILWGLAVAFGYLYARESGRWWSVLLAGLFFTLGSIVITETFSLLRSDQEGIVFFLGMGLTFIYLWTQRSATRRWGWAQYAGIASLLIAILIFTESESWIGFDIVFPVLLIALGAYLLIKGQSTKHNKPNSETES